MSYANNIVTEPVNQYDVQRALGVASGDWGTLCSHVNINPMAKYKPVRYNKRARLTLAEITTTRFGFAAVTPIFSGGDTNPSNTWEYQRVRGLSYNEAYRISDFIGYFPRACVPFAFGVSGALNDGLGIYFYINNMASTYYNDQGANVMWDNDYGLSITELFAYSSNASDNSYLTICIHDLTKGDSIVVVTNRKLRDIGSSVDTIILYPTQRTISGVTYPAVNMLNDTTRNGDQFRIIVGLMNSNTDPTSPYQVFTDETTPAPSQMNIYSLAIAKGIDRKDLILSSHYTITNLECYFDANTSTITTTYVGEVQKNGMTMIKYLVSARLVGVFVTPSDHWSPENGDVAVKLVMSANGIVGDDPVQGSVQGGTSVNIPLAGHTYYKDPLYQFTDVPVYFYQGTGSPEIYINGFSTEIYESVPFDNTLIKSIT